MKKLAYPDYSAVTEVAGSRATAAQVSMLYTRYATAASYCQGRDVLEVACGSGMGLGYLAQQASRVVGGDCTTSLVHRAREHYGNRIGLLALDAQHLPFAESSFDAIILFEAIYYLPHAESFLQEAARVLRPHGTLILCSANRECPEFVGSSFSVRYYSAGELVELLKKSGFQPQLFGAFPLEAASIKDHVVSLLRKLAASAGVIPGSLGARELLKRVFYGKLEALGPEVQEGMAHVAPLVPIPDGGSAASYRVLYALGSRQA